MKTSVKSTALSVRAVAAELIFQVLQGKSLSSLLPEQQGRVKGQDLPLLQEICFGVCRVLPRLEQILQQLLDKPLKGKSKLVHCLLLVGLYQLLYTRIPSHAAVDEMVRATRQLKLNGFAGLVNGVLRQFLREQANIVAKVDRHWQTLHPDWLVNRLKKAYPHWREIVEANNHKPPMWLRINSQKVSAENYRTLLAEQGIAILETRHTSPYAVCLAQPKSVNQLPHFAEGWLTVQDLNAQRAALWLEPKDHTWILDACAAPGGKTTHLLELAAKANVVALDVEARRLKRVAENVQRLNQHALLICGDATQPEQWLAQVAEKMAAAGKSAVQFDQILLDAPCSATGVIRRHPDIKWLRQESDIAALVQLQQQILTALWQLLKPNGVLLYATCSVLPEENCQQIQEFLQNTPDARLMPLPIEATSNDNDIGVQFFPTEFGGDGFYYAKLTKVAN